VSQFTLYGDLRKGTRPSFIDAAHPDHARPFFDSFVERVRTLAADSPALVSVHTGIFGAMMEVHLVNDGPVTIILER
jgi:D-tyrosyl-tRNA(Tyr) deacylase